MSEIRAEIKAMWILCLGGVYKRRLDKKGIDAVAKATVLNLFANYEHDQIPYIMNEMMNQLVEYAEQDITAKRDEYKKAVALREKIAVKLNM